MCAAKEGDGTAPSQPSWGEVLSSRAALVGVMLFLFQQFSGINAIVYFSSSGERRDVEGLGWVVYGLLLSRGRGGGRVSLGYGCSKLEFLRPRPICPQPTPAGCHELAVFEKAGIESGALASAAVGATNVLGTVVAAGLMDKAGRK